MATEPDTTDRTLGYLEGRITEQAAALQDMRQDLAGLRQEVKTEFREVRQEMRDGFQDVTRRIDRMFLATWAIGGGIIAALVVLIVRGG
jgi:predicted  nucleic acid-binding Zn-ribbon protein